MQTFLSQQKNIPLKKPSNLKSVQKSQIHLRALQLKYRSNTPKTLPVADCFKLGRLSIAISCSHKQTTFNLSPFEDVTTTQQNKRHNSNLPISIST